jgi:hypothetical protein
MSSATSPAFHHRHNSDGSYDSICSVCLITVASVRNKKELAEHEEIHACRAPCASISLVNIPCSPAQDSIFCANEPLPGWRTFSATPIT